jgi:hypothetical protein
MTRARGQQIGDGDPAARPERQAELLGLVSQGVAASPNCDNHLARMQEHLSVPILVAGRLLGPHQAAAGPGSRRLRGSTAPVRCSGRGCPRRDYTVDVC